MTRSIISINSLLTMVCIGHFSLQGKMILRKEKDSGQSDLAINMILIAH